MQTLDVGLIPLLLQQIIIHAKMIEIFKELLCAFDIEAFSDVGLSEETVLFHPCILQPKYPEYCAIPDPPAGLENGLKLISFILNLAIISTWFLLPFPFPLLLRSSPTSLFSPFVSVLLPPPHSNFHVLHARHTFIGIVILGTIVRDVNVGGFGDATLLVMDDAILAS